MIVQEINLYQDRFKPRKLWFSALQSVILLGALMLLLMVSSYWYQHRYTQAEQQQSQLQQQKTAANQQLDEIRKRLERLLADNQIEQQIQKVSKDIAIRKHMIDFVANNQFGSGKGFSDNLRALSEFRVNGVWLNEISLSEGDMKLSGSSLRAENVPEYFNQFRRRDMFEGRLFDVFELARSEQRDWKVDFVIASKAGLNE